MKQYPFLLQIMAGVSGKIRVWEKLVKGNELRNSTSVLVDHHFLIDDVIRKVLEEELLSETVAASQVKVMRENEDGRQEIVSNDTPVQNLETTISSPLLFVIEEEGMRVWFY